MEEIKALASEKLEFGNLGKSKIVTFLEILDDQELATWRKRMVFKSNLPVQV